MDVRSRDYQNFLDRQENKFSWLWGSAGTWTSAIKTLFGCSDIDMSGHPRTQNEFGKKIFERLK